MKTKVKRKDGQKTENRNWNVVKRYTLLPGSGDFSAKN